MFGFLTGLVLFLSLGTVVAACFWFGVMHREPEELAIAGSIGAVALICFLLLAAVLSGDIQTQSLTDGCYRVTHVLVGKTSTGHYDTIACP